MGTKPVPTSQASRNQCRRRLQDATRYLQSRSLLGLWTSFVLWKEDADEPAPSPVLGIDDILKLKDDRKKASEVKKILTRMAEERLPNRMGKRYTKIVLA